MEKSDLTNILETYNEKYKIFGYSPKTLGWDKKSHQLRYYILLDQWDLNGKTVLDFGCGFGDMYGYAKEKGINFVYHGIDINKNLITEGKKRYPGVFLEVKNIFSDKLDKEFNYIFSSGVHNFKLKDNWGYIKESFNLFDKYSTHGFAINFISNKVDFKKDDIYYSDPSEVLNLAYKYSNRVVLRNDYMPFEFTVFVNKQKDFDKKYAVYPEFLKYV